MADRIFIHHKSPISLEAEQSLEIAKIYAGRNGRIYRLHLDKSTLINPAETLNMARNNLNLDQASIARQALKSAVKLAEDDSEWLVLKKIPKEHIEFVP